MTEIQTSRDFATLLAAVQQGETVIVTKDGLPVARVVPDHTPIGVLIQQVISDFPAGPEFADAVEEAMLDHRARPDRMPD
jgi:antitoxin (DNA-binding transcriptional repressor) of toxin-antitoxin stability system